MSVRRLWRKLRLALRRDPRSARDVVRSYERYLRLQREDYLSFEASVPRWAEGQHRYLEIVLAHLPRTARVLDCACGDGTGLRALAELGFQAVVGVELSAEKAARARATGFAVALGDMHRLGFAPGVFDVVVSSHSLEHAYDPAAALREFRRVLAPGGELHVVLPYPDPGHRNELAHVGKYELGTHVEDGGETVRGFFIEQGFEVLDSRTDDVREPEIWLRLRRRADPTPG